MADRIDLDEIGMLHVENRAWDFAHYVNDDVFRDAVLFCPVGSTGNLQRSIRQFRLPRMSQVHVGGPGLEYWYYVEYGTSNNNAHPFMRSAMLRERNYDGMVLP